MSSSFKDQIKPYHQLVENGLAGSVHSRMPELLREPIAYFLNLPGKRIRPILVLVTAEAFGIDLSAALPAALAVEILHDFTLIHDDIMDEDQFRRGFPTVHNKWDTGTALLAGDAMVAIAYHHLEQCQSPYKLELYKHFTDGMYVVCAGQALDKEFERRDAVQLEEYINMISQKTGRLLSLSLEMGYLCFGNDDSTLSTLTTIGNEIGLAFQIQDDLLDFTADQEKLGKDIGSDWRQKKKTYVTITYQQFVKNQDKFPRDIFSVSSFEEALTLLHNTEILNKTSVRVKQHLDNAADLMAKIGLDHPVLNSLLDFLYKRTY